LKHSKLTLGGSVAGIFSILLVIGLAPVDDIGGSLFSDNKKFGGTFTLTHYDSDGNVLQVVETDNLVVNEGMECVSDFVFGTTSCTGEQVFTYLALGTGVTAPADAQTALITEVGACTRLQDATPAIDTATTGQRTVTVSQTFSGASCEGSAFAEVGVFDAVTTGNMLARALISPTITLGSGDTLQIDYDIVINNT
jgi:hypothetical protein